MKDCIFCKIVEKRQKASIFFENDSFLVFRPRDLLTKDHVLVIPKAHFSDIFDIDDKTLSNLMAFTKKISLEFVNKYNATGVNILHASGKDAQQSVFHFHLHLVPRYPNDGIDLWPRNKL